MIERYGKNKVPNVVISLVVHAVISIMYRGMPSNTVRPHHKVPPVNSQQPAKLLTYRAISRTGYQL